MHIICLLGILVLLEEDLMLGGLLVMRELLGIIQIDSISID